MPKLQLFTDYTEYTEHMKHCLQTDLIYDQAAAVVELQRQQEVQQVLPSQDIDYRQQVVADMVARLAVGVGVADVQFFYKIYDEHNVKVLCYLGYI